MKLVSYFHEGRTLTGMWRDGRVLDLATAGRRMNEAADFGSMLALIRGGDATLGALQRMESRLDEFGDAWLEAGRVRLLAPIPAPLRNILCVGRNYADHVREGFDKAGKATKLPEAPQFFTKATGTINGPEGDVRLDPKVTRLLDYEVELGVIIGTAGRDISTERAFQHVFGYTVLNDITARDLQKRHDQWFKGKSLDTTCPIGPCIVDRDTIGDPRTLELSLTVNGEPRQRATVGQMIFDIPTLIAELSAGLTLEAGDIIATGTPSGVGYAMTPTRALKDGDVIVAKIDRIGELRNRIVEVS